MVEAKSLVPEAEPVYELGRPLKVKDLLRVNKLYVRFKDQWDLMLAVYEGIREIVGMGLIPKHEREPQSSYERRIKELYGLGYSASVVEIFQHFLFKKNPQDRHLGKLHDDELWKQFYEDADLYGNGYEATLMDTALYAGVLGHMGILVDKANTQVTTRQQEIDSRVYPYIAKYFPQAILDWNYARDEYNRPFLNYLKLMDDDNQYRLWSPTMWEVWELPKNDKGMPDDSNVDASAILVNKGANALGEIPFAWYYNFKSRFHGIGKSDISEISRIDLSIIRNLSQIEEIINFAAFPMMRKPMRDAKPTDINAPQQDDEVSVEAVLEFDPENPESKPDWLEAEVKDPIEATWNHIQGKVAEIYRAANIGGLAATEPTAEPQSGVAKRTDFQMLEAKLVNKAINTENSENSVVEFWLKWQNQWEEMKDDVKMARPKHFDIEDLATDLANALTAKTVVISKTFNKLIQQQSARQALPGATEQQLADIDDEIEKNVDVMEKARTTMPDKDPENQDPETQSIIQDGMGEVENQLPSTEGGDEPDASGDEGS